MYSSRVAAFALDPCRLPCCQRLDLVGVIALNPWLMLMSVLGGARMQQTPALGVGGMSKGASPLCFLACIENTDEGCNWLFVLFWVF